MELSEEEIIQTLENIIKSWNNIREDCKNSDLSKQIEQIEKENKAIQGLLDLYNKQKEENKKDIKGYSKMINSLEEQLAHKTKEIKELNSEFALNTEIHKRDEEIKELKDTIKCLHEPAENYISKDKIRDKIKELQILKMTSFANNEISKQVYKEQIDLINMQINVLKNLLEEK